MYNIEELNKDEIIDLFKSVINILPSNEKERVSYYINDKLNIELDKSYLDDNLNEIKNNFKLIDEGKIYFDKLIYETGYEGSYGTSYESSYSVNDKIDKVLKYAYDTMKKCIYLKNYNMAIEICDLILYSNYKAKEIFVDDMFDDDCYDFVRLNIICDLPFKVKNIYLYEIYAIIILNENNKFRSLYDIYNETGINMEEALDKGIEYIDKEKFLKEWHNYLYKDDYLEHKKKKKNKKSKKK